MDKCPGVHPIGIGKALWCVLGKVVALATLADLEEVCGTEQLCSGFRAGMKGATHAIKELFVIWVGACHLLMQRMLLIP